MKPAADPIASVLADAIRGSGSDAGQSLKQLNPRKPLRYLVGAVLNGARAPQPKTQGDDQ